MSTQANPADRAQQSVHSMKQQAQQSYGAARQTVADKAQQAHENMVKPAFERYLDMAQRKPLMTTFASVFLLTSFIPILSFLLFSVGTLAVIGGSAFAFTLFWSGVLISIAATILGMTLAVTGIVSATAGIWMIGGYSLLRLLTNVSSAPTIGQGIMNWTQETRRLFSLQGVDSLNQLGQDTKDNVKSYADNKLNQ